MTRQRTLARIAAAGLITPLLAFAPIASADAGSKPGWTKNCTALNKKYAHGVGKTNAKDQTSGTPVTNFKKSNSLFATAMKHNKGLDRDKDKIACEKR